MNHFLHGVVRAFSETFQMPGPILEVGAYQVEGQEAIADVRRLFPGRDYVGLDMRAGPGVDCVASVEALPQADASVGTVIALNTFEHVRRFWRGFDEIRRVLRPDGMLLVSCPFFFRVHNYPEDYWRFTPQALESLLEDYPSKILGWHGPRHRPLHVWALACRARRPAITEAQFARYQTLLAQYAHDAGDGWTRRLRYALAGLFCGRGPFAPYLDRNRWETICKNDPVQSYRLSAPANLRSPAPETAR
jgi:SAM-dependent methyltransferase